jgi:predicted nucleic acid-binding protein
MPPTPSSKTRVMVDATVLIAGSGWPRWPREVLLAGLRGEFQLVLSPYVIRQAHRNLSKRFPEYLERFEEFLSQANFELVPDPSPEEVAQHKGLVRDESDIPIALAAINAGVDYLVSEDKDFTARDETTAKLHEQLKVLLSGTFLRQVMGWTSKELEEIRHREWSDFEEK